MNNQLFAIAILSLSVIFSRSQNNTDDSLIAGKKYHLTMTNSYENIVEITGVSADSITFKMDSKEFKIPRNQILFVNKNDYYTEQLINGENKVFTSDACDVYTDGGYLYKNVKLKADGDSSVFLIKTAGKQYSPVIFKSIKISEIRKIEFEGSGFVEGALIGAGTGFAAGLLLCLTWPENSDWKPPNFNQSLEISFFFAIPGALVGGIIGAVTKKNDIYLLSPGYSKTKSKRIKYLIEKHKQ